LGEIFALLPFSSVKKNSTGVLIPDGIPHHKIKYIILENFLKMFADYF